MIAFFVRPLRFLVKGVLDDHGPRRIALGLAVGMVIGLVPKGNLIALALSLVLFGTTINPGAGLCAAFVFSWIAIAWEPFLHRAGMLVLTAQGWQDTYAAIYDLPFLPWTRLNNTLVVGGLLVGLYLFYPMYWFSLKAVERLRPPLVARIQKYRLARLLFGADLSTTWSVG